MQAKRQTWKALTHPIFSVIQSYFFTFKLLRIMEENENVILSLKRQIGGLKTSNTNYRKQIDALKEERADYQQRIDSANAVIEGLRSQVAALNNQNIEHTATIAALNGEIANLQAILDNKCQRWWHRFF